MFHARAERSLRLHELGRSRGRWHREQARSALSDDWKAFSQRIGDFEAVAAASIGHPNGTGGADPVI
jgi:hypothetical protein